MEKELGDGGGGGKDGEYGRRGGKVVGYGLLAPYLRSHILYFEIDRLRNY